MADWEVNEDDYGFTQTFTLTTSSGAAYDLTPYSAGTSTSAIILRCWNKSGVVFTGACSASATPTDGTCTYIPVVANFATAGEYQWELELITASVHISTKPKSLSVSPATV